MNQCAWCGAVAVGEVELEPPKKKRDKRTGIMVVSTPAKIAPVCKDHKDIVDRQQPFYVCGCTYVEGEFKCQRHASMLRQPWRGKLSTPTIKHSQGERIVIKP
jgi:hypothetical protein